MAVERVRFPGDPIPGETGQPGAQPKIPLNQTVAPTSVEMLDQTEGEGDEENRLKDFSQSNKKPKKKGDDQDDDDISPTGEGGPPYDRERMGARIGQPPEEVAKVEVYEKELDKQDVVPCLFQRPVTLNHEGLTHKWAAGSHLVPISISGAKGTDLKMHWWLRHNKVKRTGSPQPNPRAGLDDEESDDAA